MVCVLEGEMVTHDTKSLWGVLRYCRERFPQTDWGVGGGGDSVFESSVFVSMSGGVHGVGGGTKAGPSSSSAQCTRFAGIVQLYHECGTCKESLEYPHFMDEEGAQCIVGKEKNVREA